MEARVKWLRIMTLANGAVATLVILVVYWTTLALAAIAPEISTWPLFVLLSIGLPMSVIGLRFTRNLASRAWSRFGLVVNGCTLAIYGAIVIGIGALLIGSTKERFIIPEGYRGDVYVVHSAVDGEPEKTSRGGITYRIPRDGILRTRAPMVDGWTRTEYYYELTDGALHRISHLWSTSVHRTPENLANDEDIGVFFPRSGTITDSAGCAVKYEMFYVGTKAHLLSRYQEKDTSQFLTKHPGGCSGQSR